MEEMFTILSVLLYMFGIILLVVLIILGIRMLRVLDRVDRVLDNIEKKVGSLDNLFMVIDRTSTSLAAITDKVSSSVINLFSRIFSRKKKYKEDNNYE